MFDYSYQYFLSYIISVSTNRCKVACCENVRTGAWWCLFPLPARPLTAIETSCVKQSLLSLICKVLPFAWALKKKTTLPLVQFEILPRLYFRLLSITVIITSCFFWLSLKICIRWSCAYLSLDLFLGVVCLSPPDCNPAVLGSMLCNLSLTAGGCACAIFFSAPCDVSVIDRSVVSDPSRDSPPSTPPARPKLCFWAQISWPLPTPVEANKSRAEGIGLHF